MSTTAPLPLPFYTFFERLRQNEFPVGTGDYEKFLYAMEKWMGLNIIQYHAVQAALNNGDLRHTGGAILPKDKLLRLCKLLYLKPGENTILFEELFDVCFQQDFELRDTERENVTTHTTTSADPVAPPPPPPVKPATQQETPVSVPLSSASVAVRVAIGQDNEGRNISLEQQVTETEKSKFLFTRHYYPIDKRKTQQNVKQLPAFRYLQGVAEMDEEATVNRIIEKGFFYGPAFKKYKSNTTSVLLLIDITGSMLAFEQLTDIITTEIKRALSGGRKATSGDLRIYYFYNLPHERLSTDKARTQHLSLSATLKQARKQGSSVMIISDAGAARGSYNSSRVNNTLLFLKHLQQHTAKTVWLNPLPAERWENTSAMAIAEGISMFEAGEKGIKSAVKLLKGSINRKIKNI